MDKPLNANGEPLQPWEWPEPAWRKMINRARAGRSLRPKAWPGGARCAVALSFDSDHDTTPLRDSDQSPMRISQGQYANRQGIPPHPRRPGPPRREGQLLLPGGRRR